MKPDHRFYWSWFAMDTLWMLKDTAEIPPQIVWIAMTVAFINLYRWVKVDVKPQEKT